MGELLTPTHMIVAAIVAFVLFGGRKLPELGKGLGEGLRGFKDGKRDSQTNSIRVKCQRLLQAQLKAPSDWA
jgi:TatA/E family protein of Tat protein translocase